MNINWYWMQKLKIIWYKFKAKAFSTIVNLFASQSNYDILNTVLLIGSARSGTTFLMESLNSNNEYRIIFEPFNPTYTKEWSSFSARYYIDPDSITDQERQAVNKILRGKINNGWVDQYNRKLRSDKRLIKSVRANLLLDYLESAYPELRIIYIYRNPKDVVASRISLNFDPKDVFLILEHQTFLEKYYSDIDLSVLRSLLHTPESCHAALWCLENRFILNNLHERRIIATAYHAVIGKKVTLDSKGLKLVDMQSIPSVSSSIHKNYLLSEAERMQIEQMVDLFGMSEHLK
jgi:hypothetical protein